MVSPWSLPLLIFPCTIKSRSSLLALAHRGNPGKRAVKWFWWWWSYPETYHYSKFLGKSIHYFSSHSLEGQTELPTQANSLAPPHT